jgi:serine/threonine-protein kinase
VTYDGAIKVLDFGVAKIASEGHTQTVEIRGKLSYMAPEQFLGQRVDRRADVFGMGAVLWEMVLGTPLWDKADQPVMLHRLATGDIPRPAPGANLDPELVAILVRATAAAPDQRYPTALDMQRALVAYRDRQRKVYTPREVGEKLAATFEAERSRDRVALRELLAEALAAADAEAAPGGVSPASEQSTPGRRWPLLLFGTAIALFAAFALRFRAPKSEAPAALPAPPSATPQASAASSARLAASSARLATQELDIAIPAPAASASAAEPSADARARGVARRARLPASSTRTAQPAASASAPADAARCESPYYFKDGIKTFRPECL